MAIFLKLDKAKGSATDAKFKEQIPLQSFQWGAGVGVSNAQAGDRTTSTPSVAEIVVTKQTDKSSELLFKSLLKGESLGKGTISFAAATKGEAVAYATIDIEEVIVSGFSLSSGGEPPVESVSLNFIKFDWSFTGRDEKQGGSATHLIYDISTNTVG